MSQNERWKSTSVCFLFRMIMFNGWFGETIHISVPPQHHQTPNSKQAFGGFSWGFPKEINAEDYTPPKKNQQQLGNLSAYTPLFLEPENFSKALFWPIIFGPRFDAWSKSSRTPEVPHHTLCRWPHLLWIQGSLGSQVAATEFPPTPGVCEVHVPLGSHHKPRQVTWLPLC